MITKNNILIDIIILILITTSIIFAIHNYQEDFIKIISTKNKQTYTNHIQDNISIKAHFCPKENCEQILNNYLQNATTIDCAFYDLGLDSTLYILLKKQARLIIDDHYIPKVQENTNKLTNQNLTIKELKNYFNIKTDLSTKQMHNKFCILDKEKVITGSMNPTLRGTSKNNNNLIIIESKYLAKNYQEEFNEMFIIEEYQSPNSKQVLYKTITDNKNNITIQNLFCPEDNCEKTIDQYLKSANKSIYFMTFSFTSDNIGKTIQEQLYKGLNINGIFETTQNKNSKYSEYKELSKINQNNFKLDNNKYNMHHKVFIIDNYITITGSMNPTNNGNKNNDENIIIIKDHDLARQFKLEFVQISKT